MSATILVVDDDEAIQDLLGTFLQSTGYHVIPCLSGGEGLERFHRNKPDLILLDLHLPDIDGMDVLKRVKEIDPGCPVVIITGYASARSAVEAMKIGVEDCIPKPFSLAELGLIIEKALSTPPLDQAEQRKRFSSIVGESPVMQQVFEMMERISYATATVLIRGESGTGKELVAQEIHRNSPTAGHPFVEINCSAIPDNLLETELFGYERGAFTDAKIRKKGLLELADGGTLFLDEVVLMSLGLQAKLLRVLERQSFRRLGGTKEIHVTTRFIAATNADLEKMVEEGSFREDLYYRLNVIPIYLPPLRERGEDIILLADNYLEQYSREHGRGRCMLSPQAEDLLRAYDWPGNVRELKNVAERAVLLGSGETIWPEDLSIDRRRKGIRSQTSAAPVEVTSIGDIKVSFPQWGISLDDVERKLIEEALKVKGGNVTEAAKLLHITRNTLRYRTNKYGLSADKES